MKIGQCCQRQRCTHVKLEQFWQAFVSRGFVSDSWAFLLCIAAKRWPFDSPGAISYRCSIVTESLSPTIFEIIGIFHVWVTIFTFLGHVTSSVTWPIDPPYVISYWCPIITKPLSLTVLEILGPQIPCAHTHTSIRTSVSLWGIVAKWPCGESSCVQCKLIGKW